MKTEASSLEDNELSRFSIEAERLSWENLELLKLFSRYAESQSD